MATRKTSTHFLSLSWILSPFHVNHSIPQTTSPAPPFPRSTSHGSILCGSFGYPKDRFNGIDCWSSDSLKDHLGNHLLHGLLPPLALQSLGDGCPEGGGFNGGEVDPFHGSRNSIYFPITLPFIHLPFTLEVFLRHKRGNTHWGRKLISFDVEEEKETSLNSKFSSIFQVDSVVPSVTLSAEEQSPWCPCPSSSLLSQWGREINETHAITETNEMN